MKLLKWSAITIAVIVVLVMAVGLMLPRRFQVVRDTLIEAPSDQIFPVVARPREWPTWTAWTTERYPDMKVTFSGPEQGVGSNQSWTGKSSGTGTLEITKADPQEGISYDFLLDGFRSTGGINFFPGPDGTLVAWHAEGDLGFNPINRFCGLLMESMMGPDLEKGLRNLKAKIEKASSNAALSQLQDSAPLSTPPAETTESR
jgi:hypothetical protein